MLEFMLLKYGLTYTPAPLHIIAKRIGIKESDKNIAALRKELERLVKGSKVFKSGNRYAIDAEGARSISQHFHPVDRSALPTPENFQKQFSRLIPK